MTILKIAKSHHFKQKPQNKKPLTNRSFGQKKAQ